MLTAVFYGLVVLFNERPSIIYCVVNSYILFSSGGQREVFHMHKKENKETMDTHAL